MPPATATVLAPCVRLATVRVSPVSTSVSLASRPSAAVTLVVASSLALPVSATATGASLVPVMVMVKLLLLVAPTVSRIV